MLYKDYLNNRRGYQEEAVEFLLQQKHCCLYFKPGKGKTFPCIEAIRDIDNTKNGARVLVLSSADAIHNMWETEIIEQNIMPVNTMYVTTTKAVQPDIGNMLLKQHWDVLVVDECHKIKANKTKISRLVFMLSRNIEYVFGLSGTPRGNTDVDIFCQFHNMHIGYYGGMSYTRFVDCCCVVSVQYFGVRQVKKPVAIQERFKPQWERDVALYTRRVEYDDDDKMPELIVKKSIVPYTPTKTYNEALAGIIDLPDYSTTLTKLSAITKAHQIANGFLYANTVESYNVIPIDDRETTKAAHLYDYLTQTIPELKKVVIVYKFKHDLEILRREIGLRLSCTEDLNSFKTDFNRVLFLQCSHSESINLQVADAILFYTMDYSYINYEQMIHRAWRMGRDRPVQIIAFVVEHTIEEKIWKVVQTKGQLSDLFFSIKEGHDADINTKETNA